MSKQLILSVTPNRESSKLSTAELAAAGFMSAIPTTLVTAPVERAKVLLQVRLLAITFICACLIHMIGSRTGRSRTAVYWCVRRCEASVQGGWYPKCLPWLCCYSSQRWSRKCRVRLSQCPTIVISLHAYFRSYFATYEVAKNYLTPAGSTDLNLGAVMCAGGTAGVAMWAIAIPPDVSTCFPVTYFLIDLCARSSNPGFSLRLREPTRASSTVRARRLLQMA